MNKYFWNWVVIIYRRAFASLENKGNKNMFSVTTYLCYETYLWITRIVLPSLFFCLSGTKKLEVLCPLNNRCRNNYYTSRIFYSIGYNYWAIIGHWNRDGFLFLFNILVHMSIITCQDCHFSCIYNIMHKCTILLLNQRRR